MHGGAVGGATRQAAILEHSVHVWAVLVALGVRKKRVLPTDQRTFLQSPFAGRWLETLEADPQRCRADASPRHTAVSSLCWLHEAPAPQSPHASAISLSNGTQICFEAIRGGADRGGSGRRLAHEQTSSAGPGC